MSRTKLHTGMKCKIPINYATYESLIEPNLKNEQRGLFFGTRPLESFEFIYLTSDSFKVYFRAHTKDILYLYVCIKLYTLLYYHKLLVRLTRIILSQDFETRI